MSEWSHAQDWEDLADLDPFWAILSDSEMRGGRWPIEQFLERGHRELEHTLAVGAQFALPRARGRALDFGCGVGRLTFAMAQTFDHVVGIDISPTMLAKASELKPPGVENVELLRTGGTDLAVLETESFDLVYSNRVLQHLPSQGLIVGIIAELVRVTAAGGLAVVHIPPVLARRHRLQPRRRVFRALRRVGFDAGSLYRLGLNPIRMTPVHERTVAETVQRAGGRVVAVDPDPGPDGALEPGTYFITR